MQGSGAIYGGCWERQGECAALADAGLCTPLSCNQTLVYCTATI